MDSRSEQIVTRATLLGLGAGALVGAVGGAIAVPLIGTGLGAVAGAPVGAGFGLVNGGALIRVRTPGRAALTAAGVSTTAAVVVFHGWGWAAPVLIAGSLLLGAALGPLALATPASTPLRRKTRQVIGWGVRRGLALGIAVGGIAGLVIGLETYPPTAVIAAVEGAVIALPAGLLLGLLVAGIRLLGRYRA